MTVLTALQGLPPFALMLALTSVAHAQDAPADERQVEAEPASGLPAAAGDAQALAKQLANPIAALISVPLQSNYDWGLGPDGDGTQYKLNIQPVIPITLNDNWNLISRTIIPFIVQEEVVPPGLDDNDDQSGLGDTVQSIFFSPQKPMRSGWIWGAGPVFLFPTATNDFLGGKKWGIGPTAVALKQTGPLTYGALVNHIWSVAGNDNRDDISTTFLQPFLSYTTSKAMSFTINAESTYDWKDNQWTVPVNLSVAQLFPPRLSGLPFPIQIQVGYRHYFEKAPGGPEDGVRFSIVALFPRGK